MTRTTRTTLTTLTTPMIPTTELCLLDSEEYMQMGFVEECMKGQIFLSAGRDAERRARSCSEGAGDL
jgi:hypothetical protein